MTSPGLIVMYAALAWLALATTVAIVFGRAIRIADGRCPCCDDQP